MYSTFDPNQINQPLNPILLPKSIIPQFNGEQDALNYRLGADSGVIGMDTNKPIVWILQTDASGNKVVCKPFTISPYEPEPEPDIRSLDERFQKLEDRMDGFGSMFDKLNARFDAFEEMIK